MPVFWGLGNHGGGAIFRPDDGQEHVHGRWFCLEGTVDGDKTALAVINNGQHGLDFEDSEIRLSVLRSAAYCHEQGFKLEKFPSRKYMDQGIHSIKLLLTTGHPEEILTSVSGLADWLCAPPVVYAQFPGGSITTKTISNYKKTNNLFDIYPGKIRVLACKPANNKKSLIIRLQETINQATKAGLKLTNQSITIKLDFKPHEIKTIKIEAGGKWSEVDLINE